MHQVLNTLFVMTQGSYLHLERETLKLEVERQTKLRVPLHHIGGIVLFGNVMVSPFALHRCAEDGRSVALLTEQGRFKARLEGPQSGNVLLRRAQHQLLDNESRSVDLMRMIVAGKLQNCRAVLLRGAREAVSTESGECLRLAANSMAASLRALPKAEDADVLRGIEGQAAREYFGAFSSLIRTNCEAFSMNGRNRRPPRDRINALLSFLYALLTNECVSAIESVGLDPQVGYLHVLRPGRPALALDLMEEFRPLLADRLALTLINRQQIKPDDFEERPGGAVQMSDDARRTIIAAWQQRKQDEARHEQLGQSIPWALMPMVQGRLLARFIRGEANEYIPFMPR
ncbi:MAG: subtype I-C CRISPR-associated endonuclease Cas1 [Zetaproteobacteria bacterium CG06_land_8_20_14_3_00_59_53]|nr:MAG: subtype I-C CRISPR-associated endonuclease Cas1 [Zetaproteobacteria bacterium CG2_30_59_37]PIO90310.1 MAG: subtype I-C CRISPR-associated endonuclease Cas1 [Zetaproteobacteria bacterium CG23_combo_of_CG06-09_8_20_14_all_59_86]PIQ65885.1 MAG: subtype I-C CRISPR-associated endonuclease Cas1 [Zetaproteobacteria bacterium CG11_big_fil_rev_8_21_14_0_20_59_439]PIU70529.1 MAG: subtype I-C CRISPR-associated endonuclease Cas1 [Zetaproteobacteria bacterium CG06_land_8_20_14_3_00_59_53]PIU97606.1 M